MCDVGGTSITIPELAPLRDDPPFHQRRTYYFTRGRVGPRNGHASNRRLAQSVKKNTGFLGLSPREGGPVEAPKFAV